MLLLIFYNYVVKFILLSAGLVTVIGICESLQFTFEKIIQHILYLLDIEDKEIYEYRRKWKQSKEKENKSRSEKNNKNLFSLMDFFDEFFSNFDERAEEKLDVNSSNESVIKSLQNSFSESSASESDYENFKADLVKSIPSNITINVQDDEQAEMSVVDEMITDEMLSDSLKHPYHIPISHSTYEDHILAWVLSNNSNTAATEANLLIQASESEDNSEMNENIYKLNYEEVWLNQEKISSHNSDKSEKSWSDQEITSSSDSDEYETHLNDQENIFSDDIYEELFEDFFINIYKEDYVEWSEEPWTYPENTSVNHPDDFFTSKKLIYLEEITPSRDNIQEESHRENVSDESRSSSMEIIEYPEYFESNRSSSIEVVEVSECEETETIRDGSEKSFSLACVGSNSMHSAAVASENLNSYLSYVGTFTRYFQFTDQDTNENSNKLAGEDSTSDEFADEESDKELKIGYRLEFSPVPSEDENSNEPHEILRDLIKKHDIAGIRKLLPGVDPNQVCNCQNPNCMSPLWLAALSGQNEVVELLIKSGADIYEEHQDKHILEVIDNLESSRTELVKLITNNEGSFIMADAMIRGKVEVVRVLLANQIINFNDANRTLGNFPIQLIAGQSKAAVELVPMFLQYKVDLVGVKDLSGQNILHYLVENRELTHPEVERLAKMLLDAGLPVDDTEDLFGYTPLHLACKVGNEPLISLLIIQGADIHKKSKGGLTPLSIRDSTCPDSLNSMLNFK